MYESSESFTHMSSAEVALTSFFSFQLIRIHEERLHFAAGLVTSEDVNLFKCF